VTGTARVIDGDTLAIDGVRVRLEGIDAPEAGQTCAVRGQAEPWPCGTDATRTLRALTAGQSTTCERVGTDSYGRMLGRCFAAGIELNRQMVERGHAFAFIRYSKTYVAAEASARSKGLGVWQGPAMPPWEWRHAKWEGQAALAPAGCAIKGNVSRHGRIYHMPWSRFYGRVRLDTERGERWFCSEGEALTAGWRPART
jgi:endonuclease YncB( thermonuclease family)